MLVDMALEVQMARLLRDQACRLQEARLPYAEEAAMAKLFCTEMAKRAADSAVRIFGGLGFMDETPVSRYYRDTRASTIAEGTSEIQKHINRPRPGLLQVMPRVASARYCTSARPMIRRRISDVPAPISSSLASRTRRPSGRSLR